MATSCGKCGKKTKIDAYCPTCRWLLRLPDGRRPDPSVLEAMGLPMSWAARQQAEPIPFPPLPVELWPEV